MKILLTFIFALLIVRISSSERDPLLVWGVQKHTTAKAPTTTTVSRTATANAPTTTTASRTAPKGISKKKCIEYKELAYEKIFVSRSNVMLQDKCIKGRPLIIGGVEAAFGEFPHMAALGWTNVTGRFFKCGGSLISESFVLTAAHCRIDDGPNFVRLGVPNNAKSYSDSVNKPVEINIKTFIVHPGYDSHFKYNDIALIELERGVSFTDYIRPACLHQSTYYSGNVIASGWGFNESFGETSDNMLKVQLRTTDMSKCQLIDDIVKTNSQMCVGGDEGQDTCNGDSGCPIQRSHRDIRCVFNIVGITSYGTVVCGGRSPAVYTRVSSFIDWIEQIVWG